MSHICSKDRFCKGIMLEQEPNPQQPASYLQWNHDVTVIVDKQAAKLLEKVEAKHEFIN